MLRFDEAVSALPGSVRVFDEDVRRIDTGEQSKPSDSEVAVGLRADLPNGTYTVAWRVLSADSHPIRGAFVFSVGEPVGAGVIDEVLSAEAESSAVDWALAVTRFVGIALILLAVGGVAVLAFVADGLGERTRPVWLALVAVGVLLAVDSVAWIALTGAKAAGFGLDAAFRWSLAREVLETSFGKVWVARALLGLALAGIAWAASRRRSEPLVVAAILLASAIAATPALSGHARVEGALAIVSDAVHVLAAGVWAGGLAFVALLLVRAGGERWSLAGGVVPRFSTIAVFSVAALVAAGLVSGFLEVRSWSALWETTYGRLLLAKVALLVPLLALAAYNKRVSVPRLRVGAAATRGARTRFVRTVAAELALMVVVVCVTAALVAEPPAKAEAATTLVSRDGQLGPYAYTLTVDPALTGPNTIHVYLLDATGALADVDEIALSASLPVVDIGPLELDTRRAGPGHAIASAAPLPLAGTWRFRIDVREGEFDAWSTTTDIPIGKDS